MCCGSRACRGGKHLPDAPGEVCNVTDMWPQLPGRPGPVQLHVQRQLRKRCKCHTFETAHTDDACEADSQGSEIDAV
eukprot:1159889-Pelagomonas_calceolata.AAC.9